MTASTNGSATVTVETLAAEVRVLQVGNRQITLSIYKQLDTVSPWRIKPFGRAYGQAPGTDDAYGYGMKEEAALELVGSDDEGNLVKAIVKADTDVPGIRRPAPYATDEAKEKYTYWKAQWNELLPTLESLPLIVLAGLR